MLRLEIGLSDLERLIEPKLGPVPLRIEGERLIAKRFGVDVTLGPAHCDTSRGLVVLPIEVIGAIGGAIGRSAAKGMLFGKLRKLSIPGVSLDEAQSALVLDSKSLLARLAPRFADYTLTELTFVGGEPRGSVSLAASATET